MRRDPNKKVEDFIEKNLHDRAVREFFCPFSDLMTKVDFLNLERESMATEYHTIREGDQANLIQ